MPVKATIRMGGGEINGLPRLGRRLKNRGRARPDRRHPASREQHCREKVCPIPMKSTPTIRRVQYSSVFFSSGTPLVLD